MQGGRGEGPRSPGGRGQPLPIELQSLRTPDDIMAESGDCGGDSVASTSTKQKGGILTQVVKVLTRIWPGTSSKKDGQNTGSTTEKQSRTESRTSLECEPAEEEREQCQSRGRGIGDMVHGPGTDPSGEIHHNRELSNKESSSLIQGAEQQNMVIPIHTMAEDGNRTAAPVTSTTRTDTGVLQTSSRSIHQLLMYINIGCVTRPLYAGVKSRLLTLHRFKESGEIRDVDKYSESGEIRNVDKWSAQLLRTRPGTPSGPVACRRFTHRKAIVTLGRVTFECEEAGVTALLVFCSKRAYEPFRSSSNGGGRGGVSPRAPPPDSPTRRRSAAPWIQGGRGEGPRCPGGRGQPLPIELQSLRTPDDIMAESGDCGGDSVASTSTKQKGVNCTRLWQCIRLWKRSVKSCAHPGQAQLPSNQQEPIHNLWSWRWLALVSWMTIIRDGTDFTC
ncbi:uncharacterized protein LOC144589748 [Rhinoraja longicauda]